MSMSRHGNSRPGAVRSRLLPAANTERRLYSHTKSLKPDDLPEETGRVRTVVDKFNSSSITSDPDICTTPPYSIYNGSKYKSMAVSLKKQTGRSMSIDQEVEHRRYCVCNLDELVEKIQEQVGRQIKEELQKTVVPLILEVGSIQQTSGFEWKRDFVNTFEKQSEQLDKSNKSISDLFDVIAQLRDEQNQRLEELEKSYSTKTQWLEKKFLEAERQRHEDAKVMREALAELKNTVRVSISERSHHTVIGSAQPECVQAAQQCAEELQTSKHHKGSSESDKQTGSSWSWDFFGSSNRNLKDENDSLRKQVKSCKAHLQCLQTDYESKFNRLEKDLEEAKKNSRRAKEALMKFKSQTEGEWTGIETPSTVSQNFGLLFSTVRNSSTDATLKASSGRELANDIFKVAYEECQTAVLKELFTELFCHHGPGDHDEISRADSQKRVYGMLLGLRKEPPQVTLDHDFLTEQVLKKVLRVDVIQCVKSNTKYDFAKKAVETALDMVSMQPPMIIDYPEKLSSDDIQEKQFSQWDDSLQKGEYELRYLRPVLYLSYRDQEYLQKAHVGNKRTN